MAIKRVNYFTHQLLQEQDFKDEQAYHLAMRHRHNRVFHSWGVVDGLEVQKQGEHEIFVDPGMALDREGRELILHDKMTYDLSDFSHNGEALITIVYLEQTDPEDHRKEGGVSGFVRVAETVEIVAREPEDAKEIDVILARVRFGEHGKISAVDMDLSVRTVVRRPSGGAEGWLRLPFKPVRLGGVKIGNKLASESSSEHDFIVDVAVTTSGEGGARGSMQIPVPPGATELTGFKIAGTTRRSLAVRLFRTGWNRKDNRGERSELFEETIPEGSFHKEIKVNKSLDESHALAVSVTAEAESEIWLIAAKFR